MKVLAELVNTPVVVPQEGLSSDSNRGKIRYGSDADLPDVSDEWFQSASVNTGYKMKHIIKAAVTRLEKAAKKPKDDESKPFDFEKWKKSGKKPRDTNKNSPHKA